jgi:hypothetical protein
MSTQKHYKTGNKPKNNLVWQQKVIATEEQENKKKYDDLIATGNFQLSEQEFKGATDTFIKAIKRNIIDITGYRGLLVRIQGIK